MAKQEQVSKQKVSRPADSDVEVSNSDVTNAELAESTEEVLDSIDDILEEQLDDALLADIDDVLEENAEEFVAGFVQAGGE